MKKNIQKLLSGLLLAGLGMTSAQALTMDLQPMMSLVSLSNGLSAKEIKVRLNRTGSELLSGPVVGQKDKLKYEFDEPRGFVVKNGKALYGFGIWVMDSANHTVFAAPNALNNAQPLTNKEYSALSMSLSIEKLRLQAGKHYRIRVRLFDRQGTGSLEVLQHITIAPVVKPLEILMTSTSHYGSLVEVCKQNLELAALGVVDVNTGQKITSSTVHFGQKLSMRFRGLTGFTVVAGKGFPGAEMTVLNTVGKEMFHVDDLFTSYSNGASQAFIKDQLGMTLNIPPGSLPPGRYLWVIRFFDKKSHGQIATKFWFDLH